MRTPNEGEYLEPIQAIASAREMKAIDLIAAVLLLAYGAIPFFFVAWFLNKSTFQLNTFAPVFVLGIYGAAVLDTFAVIVLRGLGKLELSEGFMKWLGATTLAEVAGMAYWVVKHSGL